MIDQFVDPEVTRAKFDREIAQFRELEADYRLRGWFLVDAKFPDVFVILAAPQLKPPAIVTGVHINYSNYDALPPSVRLIDPFTFRPYTAQELPVALNKRVALGAVAANGHESPNFQMVGAQALMQHYGPDTIPFLCIAGVREYHEHPAHTGDAWELHRAAGAGKLVRILDVIYRYGVEPIAQYNVGLVPQITGFAFSQVPE